MVLPTALNDKSGSSILHPLEFISEILGCFCKQGITIVQFWENRNSVFVVSHQFESLTGLVMLLRLATSVWVFDCTSYITSTGYISFSLWLDQLYYFDWLHQFESLTGPVILLRLATSVSVFDGTSYITSTSYISLSLWLDFLYFFDGYNSLTSWVHLPWLVT